MPEHERKKQKKPASQKGVHPAHTQAYVPLPRREPVEDGRSGWILAALLGAGALCTAALHYLPQRASETAPAAEAPAAEMRRIDAVVVDHYNPMIRAQRQPHLHSDKVQFINGVYSVVPPDR